MERLAIERLDWIRYGEASAPKHAEAREKVDGINSTRCLIVQDEPEQNRAVDRPNHESILRTFKIIN